MSLCTLHGGIEEEIAKDNSFYKFCDKCMEEDCDAWFANSLEKEIKELKERIERLEKALEDTNKSLFNLSCVIR